MAGRQRPSSISTGDGRAVTKDMITQPVRIAPRKTDVAKTFGIVVNCPLEYYQGFSRHKAEIRKQLIFLIGGVGEWLKPPVLKTQPLQNPGYRHQDADAWLATLVRDSLYAARHEDQRAYRMLGPRKPQHDAKICPHHAEGSDG